MAKNEAYNFSEACKKKDKRRKSKEVHAGIPKWKASKNQKTAQDRKELMLKRLSNKMLIQ